MTPSPDPIEAVSQRLDDFFMAQRVATAEMGPEAELIVEAGVAAVSGGKRLRARFCIAGWRAVAEAAGPSAELADDLLAAAAALEIFHAAALVHDDIIDNSDTRRGRPSAHRALEAAHRAAGWTGDPEAFGRAGAVLLGDLLVAWSDDLLEAGIASSASSRASAARAQYALMRRDVTIGQFLDVAEESAFRTEPDDRHASRALRVASLKSARYSIQQPLLIGAALAGADDDRLWVIDADVAQGDRWLLCSDGVSDYLPDSVIDSALASATHPDDAAGALVRLAMDAGSRDNITAVVCDVAPGVPVAEPPRFAGAAAIVFDDALEDTA
ncbi:MAG: polyprenyl synthetase family protein [Microbacterium sp.]|nr:polyprenyl synthetase family protein [Microbacterium sp.]